MKLLKLGTRKSLLAWAQSSWVAREVERANPGVRIELVGIETRGDRILDVPLSQVSGKEFFVAEIDEALSSGAVDLTVHSMKDLSLERPPALRLAAVPKRENPRDAILFGPGVVEKIRAGKPLRIGTSAPRRLENIPSFLERALPQLAPEGRPKLELVEIRGNVNTRLARVHEPAGSERQLDGVVLAFAGLARLWRDEKGRAELARLLDGVRWMVLPLRECPTAPAQGALAIECRADDAATLALVGRIHDAETARHVGVERQLLQQWGGGCHQRFGATSIAHPRLGDLFFVRGRKHDGEHADRLDWRAPARPAGAVVAWDGGEFRAAANETTTVATPAGALDRAPAVFVAHARAAENARLGASARVWTSGSPSWFRLAELGLWVEGSAEGLGFEALSGTLGEGVLGLAPFGDWVVLTHEDGVSGWKAARAIPTYRTRVKFDKSAGESLKTATHVFWTSGSQVEALAGHASPGARHACGPGKTAAALERAGLKEFDVFPSIEEWRKWIKS